MKPLMNSSQFYEAAKNGKLMGVKCEKCGEITCPPRMVCQECGEAGGQLIEMSKKGVIKTYTITNVSAPCFKAPYVLATVETDEGPWLMGNITSVPVNRIGEDLVGKPVRIDFREVAGDGYSDGTGIALDFVPFE